MRNARGLAFLLLLLFLSSAAPGTQSRPDFLAENIDATVSPRDDFFQYANGGWLKRNPRPDTAARWGITDVFNEEIDRRLIRISEAAAAKSARPGSDEQLVGDFWFAAMNEKALNAQGLAPLKPDLDRIDR